MFDHMRHVTAEPPLFEGVINGRTGEVISMVFHPRVVDDGSFLAALWFEGKPGQFYCADSHRQAQNLAVAGVRGASVEFLRTHYPELRNVTHLHPAA